MTESLFNGVRVLELGAGSMAGSIAGMIFADFGASVTKIEPAEGDRLRTQSPSGFLVWNRGKQSRVIDLRSLAGQEEYVALSAGADVVIEAFAPGTARDWNIGEEALRAGNPRLIYVKISGFGAGAYESIPGYECLVAAKVGLLTPVYGRVRPGPAMAGVPIASYGAAHEAFAGAVAALVARERSGRGQRVDATLLDGLVPNDYFGMMTWQHTRRLGLTSAQSSTRAALASNRGAFDLLTSDGRWIVVTQMMTHQARALSRAAGLAHTFDDPRLSGQPYFGSPEAADEWERLVRNAVRQRPGKDWNDIFLNEPDIAFELARTSEEGLDHPQVIANGNVITVRDEFVGAVRQVGPIARLSATPAVIEQSAPALGAHVDDSDQRILPPQLPAGSPNVEAPLAGVTIVEVGYFYAMPYAATIAASLGARVIKIEGPEGDPMRNSFGYPEVGGAKTMQGKESLALDLKTDAGKAVLRRAIASADVVLDGFRPGVLSRWGFAAADLLATYPHLSYVHAAGYGSEGPYVHRPIYASVAAAVAGSYDRQSHVWLRRDAVDRLTDDQILGELLPRLHTGPVDGDSNAALAVLSTILLAVYSQRRTGRGQILQTSMIGGNALAYSDDFCVYDGKPTVPKPDPDHYGLSALYRLYEAKNGWVALALTTEHEFAAFAEAVARPELLEDGRFRDATARAQNDGALVAELGLLFSGRDADSWEELLVGQGIGCVAVSDLTHSEFSCTDPELRASGKVVELNHPYFGAVLAAAPVLRFSESPTRSAPGSLVGQHTTDVLAGLDYTEAEIQQLLDEQVAFTARPFIPPYAD